MRRVPVVICFFIVPLASFAAGGPSFDCAKAESRAAGLVCGDAELALLDRRLDDVFSRALIAAGGRGVGADAAVATLRAEQFGWIGSLDDCWTEGDLRGCVEQAYLHREAELVALWTLQPPMAVTLWDCEGDPASQMRVTFLDTDLPGIRIEYGDEIHAMQLARSGSGARYTGSSGRIFWEKGGEALFVRDGETELHCNIRE